MASNATVIGILRIILTADASSWEQVAKKASKDADALTKDFKRAGQQLTDVGKTLTAGITLPLVGLAATAAKAAMDFESSFANVAKTVDGVADASGRLTIKGRELSGAIRQMAKEIPATTAELNAIAALGGQMGVPIDQLEHFTRNVAALGVAVDGISTEQAAAGLAQIGNIAGVGTRDVQQYASALVHLGNSSNATEGDILEFTKRLMGAGHAVGMSVADVMALGTAMANVGLEAEAGGTAMSTMISKMSMAVSTGGSSLQNFARIAGMTAEQFAQTWKTSPIQAVDAVVQGLARAKTSGQDLNLVVKEIGATGIRTADTMKRLAGAGTGVADSLKVANEGFATGNKHLEEAEKKYATTANQLKLLWNQIKDVGITLGNALLPTIRDLVSLASGLVPVIEKLAAGFAALPEPVRLGVIGVAAFAAALGPALVLIGQATIGVSALTAAFGTNGIAAKAMAGNVALVGRAVALLSNPFVVVAAAIGGVVIAVKTLTGSWAAAVGVIMPPLGLLITQWTRLREAVEPHLGLARDLASIVKSSLVIAWEELKRAIRPAVESLMEFVEGAKIIATLVVGSLIPVLRDLKTQIVATLVQALPMGVRELAVGLALLASKFPSLKSSISETAQDLEGYAAALSGAGSTSAKAGRDIELPVEAITTVGTSAKKSGDLVAGWQAELDGLGGKLKELRTQIDLGVLSTKELSEHFGISENAVQLFKKQLDNAEDAQKRFAKATKDAKKELDDQRETMEHVRSDLEKVALAIERAADAQDKLDMADTMRDIRAELDQVANRIEAIQDPLATAFEVFGLKSREELRKTAAEAVRAYDVIVGEFGARSPEAIAAHKKMVDAVNDATRTIPNVWVDEVFPRIKNVVENIGAAINGSFAQMLLGAKGFKDGFLDIWESIKAGIGQILTTILQDFTNRFLAGILAAMRGQQGAFAGLFSGLIPGLGGGGMSAGGFAGAANGLPGGLAPIGATPWWSTAMGGGLIGGAAGAGAGWYVGSQTGNKWGGAGAGAGVGFGTGMAFGGPIGGLIGAGIGGLVGWWQAKQANKKANNNRDDFFLQYAADQGKQFVGGAAVGSTFNDVAAELTKATGEAGGGKLFRDLIEANDPEALAKAIAAVNAELERYRAETEAATTAEEKHANQIAETKAAHEKAMDSLKERMAVLDKEEKDWDAREAPEEHMGTVEKRAREKIAKAKLDVQTAMDAQEKATADALNNIQTAAGEAGPAIGNALGDGIAAGARPSLDRLGDWIEELRRRYASGDWGTGDMRLPNERSGGSIPGFTGGTPNLDFMNFGGGTLALLHKREAVVPEGKAAEFAARHGVGGGNAPAVDTQQMAAAFVIAGKVLGLDKLGTGIGVDDWLDRLAPRFPGLASRNPGDWATKFNAALGVR